MSHFIVSSVCAYLFNHWVKQMRLNAIDWNRKMNRRFWMTVEKVIPLEDSFRPCNVFDFVFVELFFSEQN